MQIIKQQIVIKSIKNANLISLDLLPIEHVYKVIRINIIPLTYEFRSCCFNENDKIITLIALYIVYMYFIHCI